MSRTTFEKRRSNWIRTLTRVFPIALLSTAALTLPAAAGEFQVGEVTGRIDTTVSVGASMRVESQDCKLIYRANGGCQDDIAFTNFDDGDQNYDKWDVFSNTYKATVDVELAWRNFGGFFRGTLFYDLVGQEINPDRTDLARDARYRSSPINSGVVGMGYQLLDAYVYGLFDVGERVVDVRVGNQVLSWGESLFFQRGVNSINTVDLNRLRAPGSQIKEAFLPAPMVRVSTELFPNFGIEAFYQMYWNYTQVDPVGSYFSDNDLIGRAAEGFFIGPDPGTQKKSPEQIFREPIPGSGQTVVTQIRPPTGIDPFFDLLLLGLLASDPTLDPRVESVVPAFFPSGFPRLKDDEPHSQGQWGVALRYFAESIRTEFGAYYLRVHDKVPSLGFVAEPFDLVVTSTYQDFGPLIPFLPPIPPTIQPLSVPVGYYREYPNDINIFGLSASTEIWGVAWGAEVSYQTRVPVPITSNFPDALALAIESGRRVAVAGYVREKKLQAQLNAIATLGPGDPYIGALVRALRISSIAVTFEVAAVEFPSLDDDIAYAPPNTETHVDELSWGYQMLVQGYYDNPCGIPITLTPRFSFSHSVDGNTPGRYPFIEHQKAFSAGVNVDYLGVWQFDLSYTNYFGAGAANGINDRDYVSASLTYSF